jgi:hypothetical protein
MAEYKNFIQDFPQRCMNILTTCVKQAKDFDREVSLMLTVASAILLVPYERLADFKNPSGDAKKYSRAKGEFANACGNRVFLDWVAGGEITSWKFKELDLNTVKQPPASWLQNIQPLQRDRYVGHVLRHLRNAFAHGSIFTSTESTQIESLIFLCERKHDNPVKGYNLIAVLPEDFYDFLEKWVEFLASLDLSEPKGTLGQDNKKAM